MAVSQQTFARKKPDQLVYLELGSGNGGMLLSVSEDGFRFRAVSPLRPDAGVPFAFSLDGKHRLQGVGEVEWLEEDGKSGGMRFTDLSPENRVAIDQWLALDSRSHTGREVTPAAATPHDTMEKIREELRRGYPVRPAQEPRGSERETPAFRDKQARAEQPRPKTRFVPPAPKPPMEPPAMPPSPPAISSDSAFLRNPREAPPENPAAPAVFSPSPRLPATTAPRASVRPPFTEPAPETPTTPAVTAPSAAAAALNAAAPLPSLRTFTVNDTGAVSSATVPIRPYIPPPDDSYDEAWASAKLTAPAESPHLSRAAAGAIIGIALLLIVGALALNFRQDIGTLFIELGRKISGENHSAAPTSAPAEQTAADSGSATVGQPGDAGSSAEKNEGDAATGANLSSSAPAGSTASDVDAQPRSDGRPANENAANRLPSTTAASRTAGRNSAPNAAAPNPAPRDTQPTASAARTVKPVEAPLVTESAEGDSGLEEFNVARDFLKSGNRQQDLPRAVALLWSGVRKGYVPAEVTLADLYRRGEGVEKNCDQARVLLVAASKKGSPEARHMLEYMAENGCE